MQNPEIELNQYREQIFRDVVFLLNTRLRFLKEFGEAGNNLVWQSLLSGAASVFYESLFDNLIVTLSWIYSESTKDKRSLMWYLNQVKANSDVFSEEEIEEQIGRILDVRDTAEKIRRVRDKWVAHRDPVAFNDPAAFLESYQVTIDDLDLLVGLAEEVIEEHFGRFHDSDLDFELPVNGIDALTSCVKARNDLLAFAEEMDLSNGKADSEERKEKAVNTLREKFMQ